MADPRDPNVKITLPDARNQQRTRFRIDVTENDIARAKRNDSYVCVVAQAVARTIKDSTRIEVDTQAIRFTQNRRRLVFLTPPSVIGYVIAFDAGETLHPFSFTLQNPWQYARPILTPAGRKIQKAKVRAYRKAKRAGQPPEDVQAATQAAYVAAKQAFLPAGEKQELSDRAGRRIQPRVFKRKQRAYGYRLLRINQQPAES